MERNKRPIRPLHTPRPHTPQRADVDHAPRGSSAGVWLTLAFLALCIIMALSSCSRKVYLPVEHTVYKTDTLRLSSLRVDSVYVRDSISLIQRGDTIFLEKYRDRYKYINRTDTLYRVKTDSVAVKEPYPVEVVKEVPKSLAWWQTTLMWIGVACLASLLAFLFIVLRRH